MTTGVHAPTGAIDEAPRDLRRPIAISTFASLTDTNPEQDVLLWKDLVERFSTHVERSVKGGPGFSPAIYKKGTTRANHNVQCVTLAVGDFDHADWEQFRALMLGQGYECFVYSTYSSAEDAPRWRAMIPLTRPVKPVEYQEFRRRLDFHVWGGMVDESTKDSARFYWPPTCPSNANRFVKRFEGVRLDPGRLPPVPTGEIDAPSHTTDGTLRHGGRPGDDFNRRATWEQTGLTDAGWTRLATRPNPGKPSIQYWRRPDGAVKKTSPGCSATTDHYPGFFINFSDNAAPFDVWQQAPGEKRRAYSKFHVYTLLKHDGDFSSAARQLAEEGYGSSFPEDVLPRALRELVSESSASIVCPPDFIAVPLLVAAGAALGNGLEIEIKPGWREGPNLYAAIIGKPGSKKSPALGQALKPLLAVQRDLKQEHDHLVEVFKRESSHWEGQPKGERGPKPESPNFPHLYTTDATSEALAAILQHSKGLLLMRDELVGWVRGMDMYRGGKGADRQHFLSMWSRATIKVDRKHHEHPILVQRPCLAIVGGIQPDLIKDLADAAEREDGFLDRLLWVAPDSMDDRFTREGIDPAIVDAVSAEFKRLYRLHQSSDAANEGTPEPVKFKPDALDLWETWYASHVAEMRHERFSPRLEGSWSKMPAQLARLALILHAFELHVTNWLQVETLERAITLLDYFKAQARRVFGRLGQEERGGLALRVLAELKVRGECSQSALLHGVFKRHVKSDDLRLALDQLENAGLVSHRQDVQTGGRPAIYWSAA